MNSKLPPKDKSIQINHTRSNLPRPARTSESISMTASKPTGATVRASETFIKRRSGLYAGGLFIIVGAGAILGAQLKTRQQARDRRGNEEKDIVGNGGALDSGTPAPKISTEVSLGDPADTASAKVLQSPILGAVAESATKDNQMGRGASYDQRQLSFLQDRRAELIKKKTELEQKIERVKEKRLVEEQKEDRRRTHTDGKW